MTYLELIKCLVNKRNSQQGYFYHLVCCFVILTLWGQTWWCQDVICMYSILQTDFMTESPDVLMVDQLETDGDIRSDQIRLDQIRSDQIRSQKSFHLFSTTSKKHRNNTLCSGLTWLLSLSVLDLSRCYGGFQTASLHSFSSFSCQCVMQSFRCFVTAVETGNVFTCWNGTRSGLCPHGDWLMINCRSQVAGKQKLKFHLTVSLSLFHQLKSHPQSAARSVRLMENQPENIAPSVVGPPPELGELSTAQSSVSVHRCLI